MAALYIYVNVNARGRLLFWEAIDMGGRRKTILALFIWAMAAVMFMAALHPYRTWKFTRPTSLTIFFLLGISLPLVIYLFNLQHAHRGIIDQSSVLFFPFTVLVAADEIYCFCCPEKRACTFDPDCCRNGCCSSNWSYGLADLCTLYRMSSLAIAASWLRSYSYISRLVQLRQPD